MFKIKELIMYDMENKNYSYSFKAGINYFKGKNDSGKTAFYSFIDFMFGSSEEIWNKPWYAGTLSKATMIFSYNTKEFIITRTKEPDQNYLYDANEREPDSIDLREYRGKLNNIFARDEKFLKDIHNFTEEELSYRIFTMFNFLGENGFGKIHDFFYKCKDIKYSIRLNSILNFIFNKNLEIIYELKKELNRLLEELKELENRSSKFEFITTQVNSNLQKIGTHIEYTGKNADDIKKFITQVKNMEDYDTKNKIKPISELEVSYNHLCEQIKVYENHTADRKKIEKDNGNRKKLLNELNKLVKENADFNYLTDPLQNILLDIENSISFTNYLTSDETINKLKKQRILTKAEIKKTDSKFKCYSLEEKSKAIAIIEEFLTTETISLDGEIAQKKNRIKEIREDLKVLQNADDTNKINELSEYITSLYFSAKDNSSIIEDDMKQNNFKIQYFKKGNILQPTIEESSGETNKQVYYYPGSKARHTLIQLCGYLSFLKILLSDGRYPIIPVFVIDHISQSFDDENMYAIGKIIEKAYEEIKKENLQIFIFDSKDYDKLGITPSHDCNLVSEGKTGFNPFFFPT